MPIYVAKYAGYCFGVKRAVDRVHALIEDNPAGTRICTLGELIHNTRFVKELAAKGASVIEEPDLEPLMKSATAESPVKVVIRAHGTTADCMERLNRYAGQNPYFTFEDCTCPYVLNIHGIVNANSGPETLTIIVGDSGHPEVIGIRSRAKGRTLVVNSLEELQAAVASEDPENGKNEQNPIIMVAQTTQKLTEWKKCQNYIRNLYTNAKIFDTICNVTEKRQTEVDSLSGKVDLMLIIGDRKSSNTNKLYLTAKKNLDETYLIEDASELKKTVSVMPHQKVGIAAGASASSSIIEEVIKTMSEEIKENANLNGEVENFADMLEESSLKTIKSGENVKGIITSISPNEIHVDLSSKVTGIIAFSEITDNPSDKLEEMFKIGDEIEARVIKVSDLDGVATLSKKQTDSLANWNKIVEAYNEGAILEGKITEAVKSGLLISLNGVKVFIPASQSGVPKNGRSTGMSGPCRLTSASRSST